MLQPGTWRYSQTVLAVACSISLTSHAVCQLPPNANTALRPVPTEPPLGDWGPRSPTATPVKPENKPASSSSFFTRTVWTLLVLAGVVILLVASAQTQAKKHHTSASTPSSGASSRPPRSSPISKSVFISYRRVDSADITGRIYDRLTQHFGRDRIFKDVDSIPLGLDFRKHLQASVNQSGVLLAVIGKNWLAAADRGQKRIHDSKDHLRIELETALQRGIPIVPVLVQGATVPGEEELPSSLGPLAYRNGIEVRPDPDFHGDMDRLIRGVEAHLKES